MSQLSIVHWNDVYRVTPQKISPNGDTIDVSQFTAVVDNIRAKWATRPDGTRDGLSFFCGDLFSPSVESTVTRGSHLVPVMNELAPDVAMTGNHDFDFGYPHLCDLVRDNKFPWLLSNIIDENTNKCPEHLQQFQVLERSGVRVGIIGLAEQDWVTCVGAWPPNFKYKSMAETGMELSQLLRGEHQCDLVIALSHARAPNDIKLAKDLLALSPTAQDSNFAGTHGADIILGSHDHFYYVTRGVTSWEGYDVSTPCAGTEGDKGDILVVKSGTDFRELSELTLELSDAPSGSVRKKIIKAVHGKRQEIKPGMPPSSNMQNILKEVLSSVSESMDQPVCISEVELDLRSEYLRRNETPAGNWFADVLRHAFDDALRTNYGSGSDGVLLTGGTLRGDSRYPPGEITIRNILEILPFDDPAVVLELDGETLWEALEEGLSKYPDQAGRFPIVSGFRVSWDSRRPPGQRVLGVWLLQEVPQTEGSGTHTLVDGEPIKKEKTERTYKIVMPLFLANGHDGYSVLPGHRFLIDEEHAQLPSSLVRKYLLGSHYVNKTIRLQENDEDTNHLHSETANIVQQEIAHRLLQSQALDSQPATANAPHKHKLRSAAHFKDHYSVSAREHMGGVDFYDGKKMRQGTGDDTKIDISKEDLPVIHPVVDGRFKDEART